MPLRADLAALSAWGFALRTTLGDPDFVLDDDTLVVLQRFRVTERLEPDELATLTP